MQEKKFSTLPTQEKMTALVNWIEEKKGRDVLALNLVGISGCTDCAILVTASSMRHGQGLADGVLTFCGEQKFEYLGMEGYQSGQWILVDLNDVTIHIFLEPMRELYRLEQLWADAPRLHG